jgi:hypothetical protein
MWLEQLITTFSGNSGVLTSKLFNLVSSSIKNPNELRYLVECLVLRAIRIKNSIAELFLLLNLRNSEEP